jgi:hypothetical protein
VKVLLVVVLIAVAIYFTVRLVQRRGQVAPPPRRPIGPDDDPDFLRDLGRRPDDDR